MLLTFKKYASIRLPKSCNNRQSNLLPGVNELLDDSDALLDEPSLRFLSRYVLQLCFGQTLERLIQSSEGLLIILELVDFNLGGKYKLFEWLTGVSIPTVVSNCAMAYTTAPRDGSEVHQQGGCGGNLHRKILLHLLKLIYDDLFSSLLSFCIAIFFLQWWQVWRCVDVDFGNVKKKTKKQKQWVTTLQALISSMWAQ